MLSSKNASRTSLSSRACHKVVEPVVRMLQWHTYSVPLRSPLVTAHGTIREREGAIVEVVISNEIVGLGEIAPLPIFGCESLADALSLLPSLYEQLQKKSLREGLALLSTVSIASTCFPSTLYGLETALFDALGKVEGLSVSQLLCEDGNHPRPAVAVNALVGKRESEEAADEAMRAVAAGFRCIKLKVGMLGSAQAEIERVAAVRAAISPHIHLRLDANEGWDVDEAIVVLAACAPYAIQYVEQPLKARDLSGMRRLRKTVSIPIAADEALSDSESIVRFLDAEAADVLVIKPQCIGGLRQCRDIIREAARRGVQSVITSSIETGTGVVSALHLATALPEVSLECGLATLHMLESSLLAHQLTIQAGSLVVPQEAGLGVDLDHAALSRYSM